MEFFNFNRLAVEDCLNELSEPKIDDYEDHLFLVVHAVKWNGKLNHGSTDELETSEVDIFVSKNYVVTFHKEPVQSITQLRDLFSRKADASLVDGTDMLLHAILDRLVDKYLLVINEQERKIEELEDQVFEEAGENFLRKVLKVQKDVLHLRRIIGPQQETINNLAKSGRAYFRPKNLIYFRDIYDHLFRFYQMADELHALLSGIQQGYFYSLGLIALSSFSVLAFMKWKKWF